MAPARWSRSTSTRPRFPEAPVTTTHRLCIDMAAQSTQKGPPNARPRPPARRRALRRAAGAHAHLCGELPVREAGADGDPRAPFGNAPIRRGVAADAGAVASRPAARPADAAAAVAKE